MVELLRSLFALLAEEQTLQTLAKTSTVWGEKWSEIFLTLEQSRDLYVLGNFSDKHLQDFYVDK